VTGASRHSRAAGAARAVIFDMDGLLVDTEPTWRAVHTEVFGELGLELSRWPNVVTTGMRVDEVVAMRRTYHDWGEPADEVVASRITSLVAERVPSTAVICAGAPEAIGWCRERQLRVGLATGSRWPVIEAVLSSFGLESAFDACVSAGDLAYGKPHPGVYLDAAAELGVPAASCLAFEDAINGLVSAAAARMRTVIVPAGSSVGDPRTVLADVQLDSLLEIDDGRVALLAGLSEAG
jgi:beta-phosphoglucomutase-like phosphatase (HAD superfamily)